MDPIWKAGAPREDERMEPLFTAEAAGEFRARWIAVQSSFGDDPRHAVWLGDELATQVMTTLGESISTDRAKLKGNLDQDDRGSMDLMRGALRRYRALFSRLLSH